jgi:hypothetical protein
METTTATRKESMTEFSFNNGLLRDILRHAKPLGHNEEPRKLNLGFGFFYYGLVRSLRPKHTLVIGSGFGFSVVCLALGMKDNARGVLTFVDPSFSLVKDGPLKTLGGNGKWNDPEKVRDHFRQFSIENLVTHYKLTSQEFFDSYTSHSLPPIDIAFIDGNHAYRDVRHDFLRILEHSHKNTYIFLHDTNIYVREMLRHAGVKRWLKLLKKDEEYFEVINFPFSSGVALVRVLQDKIWKHAES